MRLALRSVVVAALLLTTAPAVHASAASRLPALGHGVRVVLKGVPGDGVHTVVPPVDRRRRALSTARPSRAAAPRALSATNLSTIHVNYDANFTANPTARAAFDAAVAIWERAVASPVTIEVNASLAPLPSGQLGGAGPTNFYALGDAYYPAALANALTGGDVDTSSADIDAQFSDDPSLFYFGTDGNTPADRYDFESVVLHELGHGLGFVGSVEWDTGNAHYSDPPTVFDLFTETSDGTSVLDYPNNSPALTGAVTSDALYWNGAHGASADRGREPQLYAPVTGFESGSSYSHLSDDSYPQGDPEALMTPAVSAGDAIHDPGEVMLGMFRDMGWVTPGLPGSAFTPLTPRRVLDTATTKVGNGQSRDLLLAGRYGVPVDATAVVLNVTAALPSSASVVRVYPVSRALGAPVPGVSNLNTARGDNRANLVTVPLSTGGPTDGTRTGRVRLLNNGGATRLVVDLAGYYSPTATSYFHPVAPARLMDTRSGTGVRRGRVGPGGVLDLTVAGSHGVSTTASAVTLTLTAVTPSTNTYVSAYPTGAGQTTSSVNLNRATVAANQVVVKVGSGGRIRFRNNAGSIDLVADLAGWYDTSGSGGALFRPTLPTRIVDTRPGVVGSQGVRDAVVVDDLNGVPTTATAAVLNLTGVAPTAPTFLTSYPRGAALPIASNLNLARGQTAAALATVKIGVSGRVTTRNSAGGVGLVVDLSGWFGPA